MVLAASLPQIPCWSTHKLFLVPRVMYFSRTSLDCAADPRLEQERLLILCARARLPGV
jgi:hypothetical protein